MSTRLLLLLAALSAPLSFFLVLGCHRCAELPQRSHKSRVPPCDIEGLASQLGLAPSQLRSQETQEDVCLLAVYSLHGQAIGHVVTRGNSVRELYLTLPDFGVLPPRAGTYQPDRLEPDAQAKRLAAMAARRLWLTEAPQATVRISKLEAGSVPAPLTGRVLHYARVEVTIDGGRAPYPRQATLCFDRKSGQCVEIETHSWRELPN